MAELPPGSPRRWIPEGGLQKHRERIHKESKFADDHKKLPFTFSKPQRPKKTNLFECSECGREFYAPINTVMCICPDCKKVTKARKV
ncbi:MAG: hypothetical protein DRO67_06765 [Candidatus Asgardarchaeum californiense]|nr:MAG: hypothetical protein DRO67_06765 [Candidatus Asgardarchaeum californiense]